MHRKALTGEQRFIDTQAVGLQDSPIGGHQASARQKKQIARHNLIGFDFCSAPATDDRDPAARGQFERVEGLLHLPLCFKPKHGVDQHDSENNARIHQSARENRERGRSTK